MRGLVTVAAATAVLPQNDATTTTMVSGAAEEAVATVNAVAAGTADGGIRECGANDVLDTDGVVGWQPMAVGMVM